MVLTNDNSILLGPFPMTVFICDRTVLSKGQAGSDICLSLPSEEIFVGLFQ